MTLHEVTHPQAPFRIVIEATAADLRIALFDELDFSCTDLLEAAVLMDVTTIETVTIDLRELTFVDTAGVSALLSLRAAHIELGRDVYLEQPRPHVRRVFNLLGGDPYLAAA
jgi:anti-anti-sigma factor